MSSPSRRPSVAHLPAPGRPNTLLQRLLQEISDYGNPPSSDPIHPDDEVCDSRKNSLVKERKDSSIGNIALRDQRYAIWDKGSPVAEDVRQKLKALVETRQQRQSINSSHFDNLTEPPNATGAKKASRCPPSRLVFTDFPFGRAATFSTDPLLSPSSGHSIRPFREKRGRSGTDSPDLTSKKIRRSTFPDMTCPDQEHCPPSTPPSPGKLMRAGGSAGPSLCDPALCLDFLPKDNCPLPETPSAPRCELKVTPKHAYKSYRPATPHRSPTPSDGGSPCETPAWMQSLQLIDGDVSIFKNLHGDMSRDRPLCLYCFRQHGSFQRILENGCELCGQREVLEGHYWEEPYLTQYG